MMSLNHLITLPPRRARRRARWVGVIVATHLLLGCTGDDRPFNEAIEASESGVGSLVVRALEGTLQPVSVAVGGEVLLGITAFNSAGVEIALDTDDRDWSVSDSSIASITRNGLLSGIADGEVDVNFSFGEFDASPLTVTVSSLPLDGVSSIEGPDQLEACLAADYYAVGSFGELSRSLTDVVWSLGAPGEVELISDATEIPGAIRVIANEPGTVALAATAEAVFSLTLDLVVANTLTGLNFPTGLRAVGEGESISLTATGSFTRNGIEAIVDVTDSVQWLVTDGTGSATITTVGLDRGELTGVESGSVNVEIVCGAFRASQVVQVTSDDGSDDGLAFDVGSSVTLVLTGGGLQLAVSTGSTYDDDDDVSDDVTWSSSNTGVVTVSSEGLLLPVASGTATITVALGDESETLSVTVN